MAESETNLSASVEFLRTPSLDPLGPAGGLESAASPSLALHPTASVLGSRLRTLSRLGILPETDLDRLRSMADGDFRPLLAQATFSPPGSSKSACGLAVPCA